MVKVQQLALEVRDVEMRLIDAPKLPVRASMDEAGMVELMESMALVGLKVPIKVRPVGKRFEVVYGHRRFMAATNLGWVMIPAIVQAMDDRQMIVERFTENQARENVNPVEEAYYFRQLVDEYHFTEDMLCEAVKKSVDYVAKRLKLLRGCQFVLDSLAERKITLGVAEALNQVTDENMRKSYLYHAILGEHSANTVKDWVQRWKATQMPGVQTVAQPSVVTEAQEYQPPVMACEICGPCQDTYNLRSIMVHNYEIGMLHKVIDAAKQRLAGEVDE